MAFAVQMERVRGVQNAVQSEGEHAGFMKNVSEVLAGPQEFDDINRSLMYRSVGLLLIVPTNETAAMMSERLLVR